MRLDDNKPARKPSLAAVDVFVPERRSLDVVYQFACTIMGPKTNPRFVPKLAPDETSTKISRTFEMARRLSTVKLKAGNHA